MIACYYQWPQLSYLLPQLLIHVYILSLVSIARYLLVTSKQNITEFSKLSSIPECKLYCIYFMVTHQTLVQRKLHCTLNSTEHNKIKQGFRGPALMLQILFTNTSILDRLGSCTDIRALVIIQEDPDRILNNEKACYLCRCQRVFSIDERPRLRTVHVRRRNRSSYQNSLARVEFSSSIACK